MKHVKPFIVISLIIIWTSLNYSLLGPVLARYRTLESNGFIEEQVYFNSRLDVLFDFHSFQEVVDYANANYDSYIIAAKFNRKNIGVFTKNYNWEPPFLVLSTNIDSSYSAIKKSIEVNPGYSNGIWNLSQISFSNLFANELVAQDGDANCDIYSNVPLGNNSYKYDPTNVIDAYFVVKQVLFAIALTLLIIISIRTEFKEQYREIAIYRLLGTSVCQTVQRYTLHLFNQLVLTWGTSILLVMLFEMKLLLIPELRSSLLTLPLIPLMIIIAVTLLSYTLLHYHLRHAYITNLLERSKYD